jgi:hypothetical protein
MIYDLKKISLDSNVYNKCNDCIVISGSARSGTTIVGKIIHSFTNVEYAFEPPLLYSLLPLISELNENHWKLLYETYLYEEFLMSAISGRGINCNREDDSSIYRVKSEKLINERLSKSLRKVDGEKLAQKSRIVYKMPDVVPFLCRLKKYYPGTTVLIVLRKATYVFNSLLEKGWFSDRTLREENLVWPNRLLNGTRIPFWVAPGDDKSWCEMDELHRIAYYYINVNKPVKKIHDCITVKYDDLIENPLSTAKSLAEKLKLHFGDKTLEILDTVNRTQKNRHMTILEKLKPQVRKQVEHYSRNS